LTRQARSALDGRKKKTRQDPGQASWPYYVAASRVQPVSESLPVINSDILTP
jgi:hypothetical protein